MNRTTRRRGRRTGTEKEAERPARCSSKRSSTSRGSARDAERPARYSSSNRTSRGSAMYGKRGLCPAKRSQQAENDQPGAAAGAAAHQGGQPRMQNDQPGAAAATAAHQGGQPCMKKGAFAQQKGASSQNRGPQRYPLWSWQYRSSKTAAAQHRQRKGPLPSNRGQMVTMMKMIGRGPIRTMKMMRDASRR